MKRTIAAVALVLAILAVGYWGMAGWWQEKRELSALQSEYESARELQQALLDGLKPSRERSALAGDYYVLGGTMPSVLVECGFLSNPREEALLLDPAYQQQIGQAIADGLEAYEVLLARTGQEDAA